MLRKSRSTSHISSDQPPFLIAFLILIIPVLALANIILSAQVSHLGIEIAKLNQTKADLVEANQDLEAEIYTISALTHINHQAQELGFTQSKVYLDLPGSDYVAIHQ